MLRRVFRQFDGPTWVVALVLYGTWTLLVWYNAELPWYVIMPVGAYLIAWHFSLQHEAIHSFRGVPGVAALRNCVSTAGPVVSLPSVSQESQHTSPRCASDHSWSRYRVILRHAN